MAKKVSENNIHSITEDWGRDTSNDLPYSGAAVQKFIKDTFDTKVGCFYYDVSSNRYLVFANESKKNEYVNNPTLTELVIGTFDAPFNYEASITLLTPQYNAIFLGSTGNYVDFTFDVKNKSGNSTGENVNVTYTFIRNATKRVINETRRYGETVHMNIDEYLLEGTNTVIIGIQGQTSLAATTASITYQVINLSFQDEMNISKVYDLSKGNQTVEVFFNVSGYGTKIVEWFLDGEQLPFIKSEDEVIDVTSSRTKYIELSNLANGIHTLQSRAYTIINGEKFYTDTLYRELMVTSGNNNDNMLAIATTLPHSHGLVSTQNALTLYGAEQYIPYTIRFATRKSGDVVITLDNSTLTTLHATAGSEVNYTLTYNKAGVLKLSFAGNGVNREVPISINNTSLNIEEINTQLTFDFNANGKSNSAVDKDVWSYGNYTGTFSGFNWNATSGWVNNALLLNSGASFSVDIQPLLKDATSTGKTLEFEFSTQNVEDDNAVVCDLTVNGVGLKITASEARITSAAGEYVNTKFKAGEVNRIAFVINRKTSVTYKGLVFIYVNGILSGAINYGSADNFLSSATLSFHGTDDAQVSLRSMRFYDTALSADNILNNYILYRDTLIEMMEVYYRNDIYEIGTSNFSVDLLAHYLPVMIIVGDIPTLEAATSTSTQILVDIQFIHEQDPTKSFTMKRVALRIQGTSSLAYPRKNFRFYTRVEESSLVYDYEGNLIPDKLYQFIDNAQPVDCWCLKADFAESSGTHNTGIARIWNKVMYGAVIQHTNILGEETNGYALRTEAQKIALEQDYKNDVRTTIDGFPIVLFYKQKESDTDLIFLGKYNFNNDKSTPSVFGFENIPGFDNARMQCWETKDNGHPLGLFTDVSNFDRDWSEAFESRYPDTKTPNTADLKAFSQWMSTVSQEDFATQKWAHMDVYKVAAYYVYLMRFGAVDQPVKNGFLTSEDGEHFYYINYDNDTINGLINTGELRLDPTITRQTIGTDGEYVYAGHSSVLWNRCEADTEFMDIVSIVDNALYSAGLRYDEVMSVFNDEQCDKWAERVYNQDAEYKYLLPYVNQATNNLFMLQGSRSSHRAWWLSKRFALYDSLFVSGAYRDRNVSFKCLNDTQPGQKFTITAGTDMNYGYGVNNGIRETGVELNNGDVHTFTTTDTLNLGDVVKIFGASDLAQLDLSQLASRLAVLDCSAASDTVLGSKMKKLLIGGNGNVNTELSSISGINKLTSLQELNIEDYQAITSLDLTALKDMRKVYARGSGVASINFAPGTPVEYLELPSAMMALDLKELPYLTSINLLLESGFNNINSFSFSKCPKLSNDFDFAFNILTAEENQGKLFYMDEINWEYVSPVKLIELGEAIKNNNNIKLTGTVGLLSITLEQADLLREYFGDTAFDKNAEFRIKAPDSIFLSVDPSILEGQSAQALAIVFSENEGTVRYSILSGSRQGTTIDSETGLITSIENGANDTTLTIRAIFTSETGDVIFADNRISILKRTYPTSISISGDSTLAETNTYTLNLSPADYTGEPIVSWSLSGEALDQGLIVTDDYDSTKYVIRLLSRLDVAKTATLSCSVYKSDGTTLIKTVTKTVTVAAYTYPTSVTISGSNSVQDGSVYTLTYNKTDFNGTINTVSWGLSGDLSEYVAIGKRDENSCTLHITKEVDSAKSGAITVLIMLGNGNTLQATFTILVLDPSVLMTSFTNPKVVEIMYSNGLCASPDIVTYDEAAAVTDAKFKSGSYGIFRNCKMETFEEFEHFTGLTTLPVHSFSSCSKLKIIRLPANIKKIELYAFSEQSGSQGAAIETLYLNENLESVYHNSFKNCKNLKKIYITDLEKFASISFLNPLDRGIVDYDTVGFFQHSTTNGIIYLNDEPIVDITLGNSITTVGAGCFARCSSLKKVKFTNNIKKIDHGAFYRCPIEEIIFPDSGCEIGQSVFEGSKITEVDLKNNIITGACFYNTPTLQKLKIGSECVVQSNPIARCNNVTILEGDGFVDNLYYFKNKTFSCAVKKESYPLIIPEGVETVASFACNYCEFDSITIPDSVKTIGEYAFSRVVVLNQTDFTIPSSITSGGLGAFGLMNFKMNATVHFKCNLIQSETSSVDSFVGCTHDSNLKKIKIYSSATTIPAYCFDGTRFEELEFEDSYNGTINSYAFDDCTNIKKLIMPTETTQWIPNLLSDTEQILKIYIKDLEKYCNIVTQQNTDYPLVDNEIYLNGVLLEDLVIPQSVKSLTYVKFSSNIALKTVTLHENFTSLADHVFQKCSALHTVIVKSAIPPASTDTSFNLVGKNASGKKQLIVPALSFNKYTGGAWDNLIQQGYEKIRAINITECVDLSIVAEDVTGRETTTLINWTAIVNGTDPITGQFLENVTISDTVISDEFPQNLSETETVQREISFTYMGVTATTTIIQGVYVPKYYELNLNNQWQLSVTSATNPDPTLYDGMYESFSNKGVDSTAAICYIDIFGYDTFRLYVRSYAESSYDYVMVSQLDQTINNDTSSTNVSLVKAHTSGKQNAGTSLSYYTLVEFTNIDDGKHRITIVYRKDGSQNEGDDSGYLLIPKNQ